LAKAFTPRNDKEFTSQLPIPYFPFPISPSTRSPDTTSLDEAAALDEVGPIACTEILVP